MPKFTVFVIAISYILPTLLADDYFKDPVVKEMVKVVHDQCVEETGVSEDLIEQANNQNLQRDEKLMCYLKCLFTVAGVMDDEGRLDGDIFTDMVPEDLKNAALTAVDLCFNEGGSNRCEIAYNVHKCIFDLDPSRYVLF